MIRPSLLVPILAGAAALAACTGRNPAALTDAGVADSAPAPTPDAWSSTSGFVFVASAGVDRPFFIPALGAVALRPIGPARGAGYGLGEGGLTYRTATMDGKRIVVSFETRTKEQVLFALAADGSTVAAPVRIARASSVRDLVLSPDGLELLFVDGRTLFRARLDGADANAPVRLATAPASTELTNPRWARAAGRAIFNLDAQGPYGQTVASIRSARLDGSDADAPTVLTDTGTGQHRHQLVLPDGRVVAMLEGGVLWAIPAAGGSKVRLTPSGNYASVIGPLSSGTRLLVSLAPGANWARRLAVVATDGSLADQPGYLTTVLDDLQTVLSADGTKAVFVARGEPGTWAVFEVRTDLAPPASPVQITAWLKSRPYLWAFARKGAALIGCDNTKKALLRFDRPGSSSHQPVVLASGPASQPGCPAQVENSADGSQVLYTGHDGTGSWSAFRVPLDGSAAPVLLGAANPAHLLPAGVVTLEHGYTTAAVFASTFDGKPMRLSPWHEAAIGAAVLAGEQQMVVYSVEGREPAWYAVGLEGKQADAPTRVTPIGTSGKAIGTVRSKLLLLSEKPARLLSFALDGRDAGGGVLLPDAPEAWTLLPDRGLLIVAGKGLVQAVPVEGGPATVLMERIDRARSLAYHAQSSRVVLAQESGGVLAARIDGAERAAPIEVSDLGPELYGMAVPPRGGFALLTLATLDTAVPHPRQVLAAPLDGRDPSARNPLAPPGYLVAGTADLAEPGSLQPPFFAPFFAADTAAVLSGPTGLIAARLDGSNAVAPRTLLEGSQVELVRGLPLAPAGDAWAALSEKRLHYFRLDGSAPPRALTPRLDRTVTTGLWTPGGAGIVCRTDDGHLFLASTSGLLDLTPAGLEALDVLSLRPDGSGVIFQRANGADRSLMLLPLPGAGTSPASAITPIDDAAERLVGFVR